jgi:hypothetical protein
MSSVVALMVLAVAVPAAAQYIDPDICAQGTVACDAARKEKSDKDAASEQEQQQMAAARAARARALLKTPPLPAERNGLLGSWRLADGQRSKIGQGVVTGRGELGEMIDAFKSIDKLVCEADWGGGITFTPSTYSIGGMPPLVQGKEGPIAYRSGRSGAKPVTVAITPYYHSMAFEITSPNSIVDDKGCILVRVGAPAANAAANATNAKLAVGPDAGGYLCPDGRQLYVQSCYDESSESRCGVVNMHLPPRNGFQVVTTEIRSEILPRVAACKILPLLFMNGTVSLVLPKSAPP